MSKFRWTTTIHCFYRGPEYRSRQGMSRRVQVFCAIKLAAVFDEMIKETSCSFRTTVGYWCLLRIFALHFVGREI